MSTIHTYTRSYNHVLGVYDMASGCCMETPISSLVQQQFPGRIVKVRASGAVLYVTVIPDLTLEQTTVLDSLIADHKAEFPNRSLAVCKARKVQMIKDKNLDLEAAGFEFPPATGQRFDLQLYSRSTWQGMSIADFYKMLPYPQPVRNLQEDIFYIEDSAMMAYFFGCGLARQKYIFDSSAFLINQVNACTTIEECMAVQDNRQ